MNDIERKFLLSVERGDLETLKNLLNFKDRYLDINCTDPLARNALIIAIDNENLEMVKILIENKISIGDALLYAIDENFVEAVELLLDHEEMAYQSGQPHSWEQVHENSSFSADMTPLILAAHRNNFEIIKILLDRGISPIPDPHDPRCDCAACCLARSDDCLKHSRSRINAYRALASPCLMALSSPDPLLTAFKLSSRLESLACLEPEYKQDYLKLRIQCQMFATKLLDHARTSQELEILLNYSDEHLDDYDPNNCDSLERYCYGSLYGELSSGRTDHTRIDLNSTLATSNGDTTTTYGRQFIPSNTFGGYGGGGGSKKHSILSLDSVTGRPECYRSHTRLARLRLAIQCKQKTFCAHPNIQELLATMWYENLPGFRRRNILAQTIQVIFIGLMFPLFSFAYLIAPKSKLGRYIKKPFIKFICHSASYITFLIVLILASQRVEAFYSWDSVIRLFSREIRSHQQQLHVGGLANLSNPILPADTDISTLQAAYRQLGQQAANLNGGHSSARSLDSLTKMFDQLPASSKKRGLLPSPIELIILVWVLSLLWAEIKQLRALGMNYYKADMWNTLDSVASGFYIGTIILRIVSYIQTDEASIEVAREHWHAYDPTLLSEGLFAAATIFSALKLVYIFSVNPYLGPLQISLGRMIIDILRFSWIYMLVLFSFACGMNQLLWYYADLERHQCLNITNYSLAQYYSAQYEMAMNHGGAGSTGSSIAPPAAAGSAVLNPQRPMGGDETKSLTPSSTVSPPADKSPVDSAAFNATLDDDSPKPPVTLDDSCKTWRHFSNVFESSQTLFWATFGLVDLANFDLTGIRQYTRFWALLMFGCYCFINVIVVLNLLIAMMNLSYDKISRKSDIEWKFARTRLWMSYFDTGSTVPAPFNILPSVKSVLSFIRIVLTNFINFIKTLCCCIIGIRSVTDGGGSKTMSSSSSSRQQAAKQAPATNGRNHQDHACQQAAQAASRGGIRLNTLRRIAYGRKNCRSTATYCSVMRSLVRRYLVNEQRLVERKQELTEAKLNRWAKLNAFD